MYELVPLITCGIILYYRNRGPNTMPPAIPHIPVSTAAIMQYNESFIIFDKLLNLKSFSSKLYPSFSFIKWIFYTFLILKAVSPTHIKPNTPKLKYTIKWFFANILSKNLTEKTSKKFINIKIYLLIVKWYFS